MFFCCCRKGRADTIDDDMDRTRHSSSSNLMNLDHNKNFKEIYDQLNKDCLPIYETPPELDETDSKQKIQRLQSVEL